ncbi:hypothetical protein V2W45_1337943 [Cenococcum geophilum]
MLTLHRNWLTVGDRSRCRNYRCILAQSQSCLEESLDRLQLRVRQPEGRQSYGLQAIGSHSGRRESNMTYSARCLSGAENARELRELNESEERISGAPDKFNGVVKTADLSPLR